MSLKSFLTRLIWICVVPLVLLSAYLAVDHVRSLQAERDLEAANLARNVATSLDHLIASRVSALQVLAASPLLDDPPRLAEFYRQAQGFRDSFKNHLVLADPSRQMLLITREPYGTVLPNLPTVRGHSAVKSALATGKPAVGDVFIGPISKVPTVSITVPVRRNHRTSLLLLSIIETSLFQKSLDEIAIPSGYSLTVLDGKGDLVARRSPGKNGDRPASEEGSGRIVIGSAISPWSVVLAVHRDSHRAPILSAAAAMAAAILGATLVSFLGGMLASRRLARSVASLAHPSLPGPRHQAISEIEEVRGMLAVSLAARAGAEATLSRSEVRYRSLVENAPLAIFINRNDRIEYANPATVRLFGAESDAAVLGKSPRVYVHPDFHPVMAERIGRLLHGVGVGLAETRIVQAGGAERSVEVVAASFTDRQGIAIQVMMQDITERKRAEARVQRHIEVMRGINGIFQDAMQQLSTEELGARCLAVAQEITGSRYGFVAEIGPDGLLHDVAISDPDGEACTRSDQRLGRRRVPGSFAIPGVCGRVVPESKGFFSNDPAGHPDSVGLPAGHPPLECFLGVPLTLGGRSCGMIAVGNREEGYSRIDQESLEALAPVVVEVFLRNRAELALKERERRLSRAEEMAHLGHWRHDLVTGQVTWSDEMYRIFGLELDAGLPGCWEEKITRFCHPDDLEPCAQSCDPAGEHAGEHGGDSFEYRIVRPDGGERHVVSRGEMLRDEYGTPVALFGTLLDGTELRHKERELQQKNAELERFTYMISHDLKSPLVTVKTFLGYLEQDLADSNAPRVEKDLGFMRGAADKMGRLLDELLEMSRVGRTVNPAVAVSCGSVINEALGLVAGALSERGVEVQAAPPGLTLFGDQPRLVEIWQNLVENACKFMGDQEQPVIRIGAQEGGRGTVFFVSDNGVGIEPKYQEKVFGLFEKLDRNVGGTGLGLALVRRIVELYGGKIWVESHGAGSCFRFTLPGAVRTTRKELEHDCCDHQHFAGR